jgi:hypothetical protein
VKRWPIENSHQDRAGTIVLHKEVPAEPAAFLQAIAPFRDDLVVACECLFCLHWLADLCHAENIAFVLSHAVYTAARRPAPMLRRRTATPRPVLKPNFH